MARLERLLGASICLTPSGPACGCPKSFRTILSNLEFSSDPTNTSSIKKPTGWWASLWMARLERFELPTARFVAEYSIQLSYRRLFVFKVRPYISNSIFSQYSGEIIPGYPSAIAPALLYHLHPCRRALHPSGQPPAVQNRSRRFCRTPDHSLHGRVLYPAELQALI